MLRVQGGKVTLTRHSQYTRHPAKPPSSASTHLILTQSMAFAVVSISDGKSEAFLLRSPQSQCTLSFRLFGENPQSGIHFPSCCRYTHVFHKNRGFSEPHMTFLGEMHREILFYSFPLFNDNFNEINCCHNTLKSHQLEFEKHSPRICHNLILSLQHQSSRVNYEFFNQSCIASVFLFFHPSRYPSIHPVNICQYVEVEPTFGFPIRGNCAISSTLSSQDRKTQIIKPWKESISGRYTPQKCPEGPL